MKIKPEQIIEIVCEYYRINPEQIKRRDRRRVYRQPRQVCYYLMRFNTDLKLMEMAELLRGNKSEPNDHTTVIHACRTVRNIMEVDADFRREVMTMQMKINGISNELIERTLTPEKVKEPIKVPEKRREVVFSEAEKVVNKYL